MIDKIQFSAQRALLMIISVCLLALFASVGVTQKANALTPIPVPNPKPGSFGLEATKKKAPPTQGATITTPGNGASFDNSPITVNGICPNDLLVQVFNNGVMVGSVMCVNGSFSLQVSLFAGTNELSANVYDELDQTGPVSSIVTINYTDTRFTAFGQLVTLTSSFGRRSAPAGTTLDWPLQLSGGAGPYAFSIDWGDGSKPELKSQALTGVVPISHVYKKAGIYQVNITVTDVNGAAAFLQLIAVSSGQVEAGSSATGVADGSTDGAVAKPEIMWTPTIVSLALLAPAFFLGRLSQLTTLRNKLLKDRETYK